VIFGLVNPVRFPEMANEYFETSSSDRWDQHYSTSFAKTFMTAVPAEQSQVRDAFSSQPLYRA
jgi:hypothetical protein